MYELPYQVVDCNLPPPVVALPTYFYTLHHGTQLLQSRGNISSLGTRLTRITKLVFAAVMAPLIPLITGPIMVIGSSRALSSVFGMSCNWLGLLGTISLIL